MKKHKTGNGSIGVFEKRKTTAEDMLVGLYDFLERFPVCLPVLNSVLKRYRVYLNGNLKECTAKAAGCVLKIYIASAVTFCIVFFTVPSWFTLFSALYMVYFYYTEFLSSAVTKLEIRFLKGFDSFLGTIRHYYYKTGSIKDALIMAESDSDRIMRGHIRTMSACLNAADPAAGVNAFLNGGYHKHLKLFLALARLVEENGDIEDENGSVFLNSCMHLKYDIEEEARFISEKRHRFSGLMYTAVLPVLAVPFIALWGVSTIPSLNLFYNGYVGAAVKTVLILVSFLCYNALLELRDGEKLGKKKHTVAAALTGIPVWERIVSTVMALSGKKPDRIADDLKHLCQAYKVKTFYSLKLIYLFAGFTTAMLIFSMGHAESARIYKYDTSDISQLTSVADSRQLSAMEKLIPEYTAYILDNGLNPEKTELVEKLLGEKDIKTETVAVSAAEEILERTEKYRMEHTGPKDILFALIAALVLFCLPDVVLFFKKALIEGRIRDEIMQYQSIIHMLKKVPGVSAIYIMEEMERFSEVFRPAIKQCIDEYSISGEKAISRLYEADKSHEWRNLIDSFMMADELGIEDAFEEISSEIENFKENRKLDRRILLDTEGMLGAVIAVLPGGLILFGYLLCPFMVRSMQIFNEYQSGMTMN